MNLKTRLKLWFLDTQDNITVILVFVIILGSFLLLDRCSSVRPNYEEYTQETEIIEVNYQYLYTHNGMSDSVPKVNGTEYQLLYRVNGTRVECVVFVTHYDSRINRHIEAGNFNLLEIRCIPHNIFRAMIFLKR